MNIFMAAVYTNSYKPGMNRYIKLNDREKEAVEDLPNILESYHYVNKQSYVDAMRTDKAQVFIDSGAFSAHTLGVTIDLPTYCNYIKQNQDIIRVEDGVMMASVLDGIGDALKTYQNQMEMERLGAKPLPCFHVGEDEQYLEWYVAKYDYITLGGMVIQTKEVLIKWLDRIWEKYLTDGSGNPKLKVHGFGVTSTELMQRYPWWSCDSSSWIQAAAFGSIIEPVHGPISVSDKSPSRHKPGQHANSFSKPEKEYLFNKFKEQGFNYERLSTVYESRAAYNLWSFGVVNKMINETCVQQFKGHVQELF